MNTLKIFLKRIVLLSVTLISTLIGFAQADGPVVWQWSAPVKGVINTQGQSTAFLWIPQNCSKVRGLVLGQNNMQEISIMENQQFRDSLASIGFGEIFVGPAFRPFFNAMEGDKIVLEAMLKDLADKSGYPEIFYAPLVPIGHSAMANFAFQILTACPERALCGISTSGMMPYDFGNAVGVNTQCGSTVDYIPYLTAISELESGGEPSSSGEVQLGFNLRTSYPKTPLSFLGVAGEFHFGTTQKRNNFFAMYIKKAAKYRLAVDATAASYATLTPIDPTTSGWLVDRWQRDMVPRYPTAPVASYTGSKSQNFWCFDEDMARRTESLEASQYRKTPCLMAYNQSNVAGQVGAQVPQIEQHVQCQLAFTPLNDSLDFELSSSFLDTIPATSSRCTHFMSTTDPITGATITPAVGTHITHPATSNSNLCFINKECNMLSKIRKNDVTGITTFRMSLDRGIGPTITNYGPVFALEFLGDATYKASFLQAGMTIPVRNTSGLAQTITFPQIANVPNVLNPVSLNATSNLGLPVQYYMCEGPAQIVGNKIVFTQIPPSSKYPVKVTVVAWQWGRNSALATRLSSSQVQTATPVINTFYIQSNLQPVVDLSKLEATLVNQNLISLDWKSFTELYNNSYEIQKSLDNSNWTKLGTVTANGAGSTYQFSDINPVNGYNYYRLKVISSDLSYTYSDVVSVVDGFTTAIEKLGDVGLKLTKVQNTIQIKGGIENSNLGLTIYDNMGKAIFVESDRFSPNGIIITQLPDLAKGVYIVRVKNEDQIKSLKILID